MVVLSVQAAPHMAQCSSIVGVLPADRALLNAPKLLVKTEGLTVLA